MMGWALGYDDNWHRDIGYGVPAKCDHPRCLADIDRGLSYVCGGEAYGGEHGCGLFFCASHRTGPAQRCARCRRRKQPFKPSRDVLRWMQHKLRDPSWAQWRADNPLEVIPLFVSVGIIENDTFTPAWLRLPLTPAVTGKNTVS